MKVGFQVEGPTDLRVLRFLVETIIGAPVEPMEYQRRGGGVHEVFRTLKESVNHAHIEGCRALVIHVDENGTMPHDGHQANAPGNCRFCEINNRLTSMAWQDGSGPLLVAVPVQAMVAWLLHFEPCGAHQQPLPGEPQTLDRRTAKTLLWGSRKPRRRRVDQVLGRVWTKAGTTGLDDLARVQPSFQAFREAVLRWKQADKKNADSAGAR